MQYGSRRCPPVKIFEQAESELKAADKISEMQGES